MGFTKTIKNIWSIDDLRKRIGITLLLVIIYRFGCYVVLPGINPDELMALKNFTADGLMQLIDMFSGGAFSQASIPIRFAGLWRGPRGKHSRIAALTSSLTSWLAVNF